MLTKTLRRIGYAGIAAILISASLFATSPAAQQEPVPAEVAGWDFQGEAADLLKEVQVLSGELHPIADQLTALSRSNVSWVTHAERLNAVRDNINQIGERLKRLQEIRHVTSPMQQQAIDRVVPVAVDLASHTEAAIGHINEHKGYLFAPAYKDHLTSIVAGVSDMKSSIDLFMDHADTQERLEQLQEKLAVIES